MADELDYPRFEPGDLSPSRWEIAVIASAAFMAADIQMLLDVLKEEATVVMVHTCEDGVRWCLHLPEVWGLDNSLKWDSLPLLLQAGIAHCLKHQEDKAREAFNN